MLPSAKTISTSTNPARACRKEFRTASRAMRYASSRTIGCSAIARPCTRTRKSGAAPGWLPGRSIEFWLELAAQVRKRLRQISSLRVRPPEARQRPCRPSLIAARPRSIATSRCSAASSRPVRQQPAYGFESEHHSLKALKQRVVQFPRNAGTFPDAVLEALFETLPQLLIQVSDAQQMREREHADQKNDAQILEHWE